MRVLYYYTLDTLFFRLSLKETSKVSSVFNRRKLIAFCFFTLLMRLFMTMKKRSESTKTRELLNVKKLVQR